MKRIQAACIMQTLTFSQKEENGFGRDEALRLNRAEFEHYKETLARTRTRHQIDSVEELDDGSIRVRVRKQYNSKADVAEYFG